MNEETKAAAAAKALVEAIRQDFPGLEAQMDLVSRIILSEMKHMLLQELIYRSLMTGATLTAEKYRKSQEGKEDLLNRLTRVSKEI